MIRKNNARVRTMTREINHIIVHCTASPEGQEMTVKQIDSIHRNERHWADGRFIEIRLSQAFLEYGLWQDYGVGRETPRGNSGDIGRKKVRQRRPWFSKKYFASVMNIKEFYADNLGHEFQGIIADAFASIRQHM